MGYSGAGGILIHEKKPEAKKSRDTVPLTMDLVGLRSPFPCNKLHIVQITRAVPTLLQSLLLSSTAANCSPFLKSNFSSSRVQTL
jgi:hypothetical protein